MPTASQRMAKIDASLALLLAVLAAWAIVAAFQAAAEAERLYGRNVDSGAHLYVVGVLYLAPLSALFTAAAASYWRAWRVARSLHWLAVTAAALPVVLILGAEVRRVL